MTLHQHFQQIKQQFFPRWDRRNEWRISTRSRRKVHGHCDPERQIIEIVAKHYDPDERDRLLIHEICHAVASGGHGKAWQSRMEIAAKRADELGRHRLAELLREEIVDYRERSDDCRQMAYQEIQDAVNGNPEITLAQMKRWIADQYGLLVSEVSTQLKRLKAVFEEAKRDAQEARAMKEKWVTEQRVVSH